MFVQKKLFSGALCVCLVFVSVVSSLEIGTPASLIDGVLKQRTRATTLLTLPICCGADLPLIIDYYSYENGWLSLTGKVASESNSDFMLRGDSKDIYGWIHLKDDDVVFRYETDNTGTVVVEQVPVSEILSINKMSAGQSGYEPPAPDYRERDLPPIPHVGPLPSSVDLNNLQSKPGSSRVLWLDIRELMRGSEPITVSRDYVWVAWQIVAAGFSMFDVNVTTSQSVYNAVSDRNRGVSTFRNTNGRSFCYLNAFGSGRGCTVYKAQSGTGTGYEGGRTALHEKGHLLGVADAGHTSQGTYYAGLTEFKWVPIMGNFFSGNRWGNEALYQWSKGEYSGANNAAKQDFYQRAGNHLTLLADDHPNPAALIINNNAVAMVDNYGRIGTNGDSDEFRFEISAANGSVDLKIDRIEHIGGGMLDVDAAILDASGSVVVSDNKKAIRNATLRTTLSRGTYTLRIKGGVEGTPLAGFSNYSSVGYYGIYGTIEGGVTDIAQGNVAGTYATVTMKRNSFIFSNCRNEPGTITLYSADGKKMMQREFSAREQTVFIEAAPLSSGLILYRIATPEQKISGKMVVR